VAETRGFIEEGERQGLFGKGGPNTRYVARAHPLVRDFLQARLLRSIGDIGVRDVHLRVAKAAETVDWRIAGRHYLASGRENDARRVLGSAIENILATGAYAAAEELSSSLASGALGGTPGLVLRSRIALQRAATAEAVELAERAYAEDPRSPAVLLSLVSARNLAGDVAGAIDAGRMLELSAGTELAAIGRAYQRTMETSVDGSLEIAAAELELLCAGLRSRGETHFLGVALLNLAYVRSEMGLPSEAVPIADESISLLSATSAGVELISARAARAGALAQLGDIHSAREEAAKCVSAAVPGQALELAVEIGQFEALYGEASRAWPYFAAVEPEIGQSTDHGEQALYARILLKARAYDLDSARKDLEGFMYGEPRSEIAFEARRHLAKGLVLALDGDPKASESIGIGTALARKQKAHLWAEYGSALGGLIDPTNNPSALVARLGRDNPVILTMLAEVVCSRIHEAERRPWRWRSPARHVLRSNAEAQHGAAHLLERIGELADIPALRDANRTSRDRGNAKPAYNLARRLAARVLVEDLGRVRIVAGSRAIEGSDVRRKVLALLCLLISKSRFASTREEVVDSLWPDLDPPSALNSLNQTVYFLRRVFEPHYREDTSPGYLGQDGETIWLDQELVDGQSRLCLELIRSTAGPPSPEIALALANQYRGKFALDFAYDDWATGYRDALHAGYLRVMEHAIRIDIDTAHFGRGTYLAERAIEIDPDSEEIQAALVRLYRLSGAHAAASEQYGHYAATMRELGLEPAPYLDV
jgi:DNA-binding SARP family transcriptional activator